MLASFYINWNSQIPFTNTPQSFRLSSSGYQRTPQASIFLLLLISYNVEISSETLYDDRDKKISGLLLSPVL
jgi:hypothetical protein